MDQRQQQLSHWIGEHFNIQPPQLITVSGDASFRRYFRFELQGKPLVVVDAPPPQENCHSFVAIAQYWHSQGIHTPEVLAVDFELGFMCLEDFGDQLLRPLLDDKKAANQYYQQALTDLVAVQKLSNTSQLPRYDDALLMREQMLLKDWLIGEHLQLQLSSDEAQLLDDVFHLLSESAQQQLQVTVHRDYHSRNLMLLPDQNIGMIDFQDAVLGPVTYDVASLLKDCYIAWPRQQQLQWLEHWAQQAKSAGLELPEQKQLIRDFDLISMQRHFKAAGIFARLNHRDGKPGYMADIPRTLGYAIEVCQLYPEFEKLGEFLQQRVIKSLISAQ